MHPLLRQALHQLEPELPQFDPIPRHFRMLRDHSQHVAGGGLGIHAKQKIRSRQIEEAQRMRLHKLGAMQKLTQPDRSRRDFHRHNGFTRFRGSEQVAHRANTADAGGDSGHLVIRTSLGELLKAAHLRDVKFGAGYVTLIIQLDGDLGVSFNAGHRVDRDALHLRSLPELHTETFRFFPFQQILQHSRYGLCWRWTAGQK
jgi:hypothetical protein